MSKRARAWLGVILIGLLCFMMSAAPMQQASAAQLTVRALTLQPGTTDGASKPSGVVKHQFSFTVTTSASIGSIQFLYCKTASGTCNTPTGLTTTSAALGTMSGATFSSVNNSVNGAPYVTRTASSLPATTQVSIQLTNITNPDATDCPANATAPSCPFYVRITTFTSTTASTGSTDTGTVAAAVNQQIVLTGTMPESLIFCTGGTIGTTVSGIPDCSTATSGSITFNQLFSPAATATATSQTAVSTNGLGGYVITISGTTLSAGSNTIPALASTTPGAIGFGQFGLNLVANTTAASNPAVGTAVTPAANGTTLKGEAVNNYNTPDSFRFVSGETVADSGSGGLGPTNAQIFTTSYIVNVAGGQPAGTYTTTLTYTCTATF